MTFKRTGSGSRVTRAGKRKALRTDLANQSDRLVHVSVPLLQIGVPLLTTKQSNRAGKLQLVAMKRAYEGIGQKLT